MVERVQNELALVTGAGRGIGREVARQLAARGFRVVVAARELADAEQVAATLDGVGLALDVTSEADVAAVTERVRSWGHLDVLVNNAGTAPDFDRTVLTADPHAVDAAWHTNVLGTWRLIQALAPALRLADNPRVVNVCAASGAHGDAELGLGARVELPAYSVTKAALGALTHKLSVELPQARVNAVDPGRTASADEAQDDEELRPLAAGASSIVWAATLGPDGPTGGFFRDSRPIPW